MDYFKSFLTKVSKKNLTIGVVGLGYTGLPLSVRFCEKGLTVVGLDIDEQKIALLADQKSYLKDISDSLLKELGNKFRPTSDFSHIALCDAVILCLPTPLQEGRIPDLSYLSESIKKISPYLREGQLISLESTSFPGTTEEFIVTPLKKMGFTIGKDFFVVYSPERIDPGRRDFTIQTTPKVCGGVTPDCLTLGKSLYEMIVDQVFSVRDTKTAEFTKLLENVQRMVNIGLMNEMKIIADKMGIDIYEVIKAADTKPFGFTAYGPGPGVGGHCIPVDPFYLSWKAREYGESSVLIEMAGDINNRMPDYVVQKTISALEVRNLKVEGARVLILGVAYKRDVEDLRGSPALDIIKKLCEKKMFVHFFDPHVAYIPVDMGEQFLNHSIDLSKNHIHDYDVTVLITDHCELDYDLFFQESSILIDTRGRFPKHEKVIKA